MTINKPDIKFKCGAVNVAVWSKELDVPTGGKRKFYTITVEKSYKDGEEWKHTNAYNVDDIPKITTALRKAYEYLTVEEIK